MRVQVAYSRGHVLIFVVNIVLGLVQILVEHDITNIDIKGKDLECMAGVNWLNDEVINVYMGLLQVSFHLKPRSCQTVVATTNHLLVRGLESTKYKPYVKP